MNDRDKMNNHPEIGSDDYLVIMRWIRTLVRLELMSMEEAAVIADEYEPYVEKFRRVLDSKIQRDKIKAIKDKIRKKSKI